MVQLSGRDEQGYVRINATLQKEDDESYTILTEVVDTGVGVSSASSSTLFTPFTQFDNSATKQYKGTGLGLSIFKSLAERMGGNIGFQPNPEGHGSIFWFTAELKKVKQLNRVDTLQEKMKAQAIQTPALPLDEFKLAAAGKKVLLTEDNPINQKVMLKMLKGLGLERYHLGIYGGTVLVGMTNVEVFTNGHGLPSIGGLPSANGFASVD
ncbi:sensor histidine kinase response [Paraphaeosphaeria sporulosa]